MKVSEPYYKDNHITLYNQDCRSMNELPDESVQMCVTSPPYWGLRKYSGEQELIWGSQVCEHLWIEQTRKGEGRAGGHLPHLGDSFDLRNSGLLVKTEVKTNTCSLCGAWKGSYGLEPTPEMYIEHTILILREIRRVLRKDGVVFWNIGDSYAANRSYQVTDTKWRDVGNTKASQVPKGMKPKDLCLIPFRVALEAQMDGWWVRSIIIWSKPNPMPESVTDRPTESHEYILMLTKSARYYWDADAVREASTPLSFERMKHQFSSSSKRDEDTGRPAFYTHFNPEAGRNIRSVWEFPTQPYPEAHFAVFPEKLPEICIKAATPEVGCCSKCGAPWERVTENKPMEIRRTDWGDKAGNRTASSGTMINPAESKTLGWQPTCKCNAPKVPSIVLDPFAGAGTTLYVAKKLNRKAVGYELSDSYCPLVVDRCRQQVML